MDPLEPARKPPLPPQAAAPAPPPAALINPNVTHVPLTPMMEFLQRRLEGLEKELAVERERAQSAQGLLQQQESLKSQVEEQLKLMTDSLRREKGERDNEEIKAHARGRIDALEKRLDEMHQSWAGLLREAVAQRESNQARTATSRENFATLQETVKDLAEQLGHWRGEWRSELRALASRPAEDERRFQQEISQMMSRLSSELRERIGDWERRQSLEMEKHEERLQAFAREKAALLRAIEEQNNQIRQDGLKERIQRETQSAEQVAALSRQIEALRAEAAEGRAALSRVHDAVTVPPQAKDKIIESLESEKEELLESLRQRGESLKEHIGERREMERAMADSLAAAQRELEDARAKQQILTARLAEADLARARLADELKSAERLRQDQDERRGPLEAERDMLAKALLAEAERARLLVEERSRSEDAWAKRLSEIQERLSAEIELKTNGASAIAELRGQIATLSEHMSRALQERDAAVNRHASWDKERAELLKRLREKEEMISMLNNTFQKFLKPGSGA